MDAKKDQERVLYQARRFRVVEREQQSRDGRLLTRDVVLHPGAVVILPMLDDGRVVLIRNERVAVAKTLVELPAGTLDPPETPATCARRELQEETGYAAERWRELPSFFMSPGILCERMHVFVAEGLSSGEHSREAGENIDNLVTPWAEALAMCERGEIEDAKTICALLMWDRLRGRA